MSADPFQEQAPLRRLREMELLGARFTFESNSAALLKIVDAAYGRLPPQRFPGELALLKVSLRLLPPGRSSARPAALALLHAADYLGGASPQSNCVVVSPRQGSALVLIAASMLRHPYHIRYEFIEFAVFTLAARAQGLLALHGACVGRHGHGLLIVGDSGAGKSTVALHAMLAGFEVLSEDSVFIRAESLLATGVPNFVHLRAESLRLIDSSEVRALVRESPTIRRRSGVKKYELDLRQAPFNLAKKPLVLTGIVFLSARRAAGKALVRALSTAVATKRLAKAQPYASRHPEWRELRRQFARLDCVELRRGDHPRESVAALSSLLPKRI